MYRKGYVDHAIGEILLCKRLQLMYFPAKICTKLAPWPPAPTALYIWGQVTAQMIKTAALKVKKVAGNRALALFVRSPLFKLFKTVDE